VEPTVLAVHGCTVALGDGEEALDARWMTRAERRQCAALETPHQRADYRASRLAAKRAAMRVVRGEGTPSADVYGPESLRRVSVERRAGTGPAVRIRAQDGGWQAFRGTLSLAHRDGRAAAVAVSAGARIGVDIERASTLEPAHLRYFAAEGEVSLGPSDPAALWALKEAAWKAVGLGANAPLRSLMLEFDAARQVSAVTVDGRRRAARATLLRPWPTHVVAVLRLEDA